MSSENMTLVGVVDSLFTNLQCAGIEVTGVGIKRGAKICFRPDPSGDHNTVITADSIQINHLDVSEVNVGDQFAVKLPVPIEGLFKVGTPVFLVTDGDNKPSVQNAGTDHEQQDWKQI